MRAPISVFLALILAASVGAQTSEALPAVVSPQWLQKHQKDADLVVLHVAFSRRDYTREHIPGARFIWFSWLSPSTPDGSTEMASIPEAVQVLEEIGISRESRLVVYFTGNNVSTTTRTIFSLLYFGFEGRVALLDGGLDGWKRTGGSVTKDVPSVNRTSLQLELRADLLADAEYVRKHLDDASVSIVDARSKNFYDGSGSGTRPGHIKGAVSMPFSTIVDSLNQFKSRDELEKIFREAGVKKGTTVVAYCHVGQQATIVLQAARLLGYQMKLYDGSYEEWPSLDEARYPVEQTPVSDKP